jgi:hypothetical protein
MSKCCSTVSHTHFQVNNAHRHRKKIAWRRCTMVPEYAVCRRWMERKAAHHGFK